MVPGLILYAENSVDDVELTERMFRQLQVLNPLKFVRDGDEAADYLRGVGKYADRTAYPFPSLVFLDIGMPNLDGFEVLQIIRFEPAFKKLPVIMVSDSDAPPDQARAYEFGATAFFTKTNLSDRFTALLRDINNSDLVQKYPEAVIQFSHLQK